MSGIFVHQQYDGPGDVIRNSIDSVCFGASRWDHWPLKVLGIATFFEISSIQSGEHHHHHSNNNSNNKKKKNNNKNNNFPQKTCHKIKTPALPYPDTLYDFLKDPSISMPFVGHRCECWYGDDYLWKHLKKKILSRGASSVNGDGRQFITYSPYPVPLTIES